MEKLQNTNKNVYNTTEKRSNFTTFDMPYDTLFEKNPV